MIIKWNLNCHFSGAKYKAVLKFGIMLEFTFVPYLCRLIEKN